MKLDFSKFKKISSDKKRTVLMHPSGHKIVIAREKLNPVNLDQLDRLASAYNYEPGMAEGGDVAPKDSDIFINTKSAINRNMIGNYKEKYKIPEDLPDDEYTGDDIEAMRRGVAKSEGKKINFGNVTTEDIRSYKSGGMVKADDGGDMGEVEKFNASGDPDYVEPGRFFGMKPEMLDDKSGIRQYPIPKDQMDFPEPTIQPGEKEFLGSRGPSSEAPNVAQPEEQEYKSDYPTVNTAPLPPYPAYAAPKGAANDPYAAANETALSGLQKQGEAAQETSTAMRGLGTQEATANSMAANALNANQANFQKAYQDLTKERQTQYDDASKGHIDPNRYIKSMTTGEKILNAISLIIGGGGAGLSGQQNLAANYLTDQINRDVDAQKFDLNNKNTLLSQNLAQTGNLFHATELTKMQIMDLNAMHLKQLAAAAQDPLQKANLLTATSQIDQKASELQVQIATRQALMQTYEKGGEKNFQQRMRLLKVMGQDKMAEDTEKRHVPGVGTASKEVPADISQQIISRNALNDAIEDLQNFANQNSGSINPAAIAQGEAKAALVQDMVRQASNAGVFKESEKEFMNRYVGENPTQLFQKYRSGKGYEEVRRNNLLNLNSVKKTYGLPVTGKQSSGAAGTPRLEKHGNSTYMKVPGGWKKVK